MNQPDLFPTYVQRGDSIVPRDHRGNARPSIEHARAEANEGMRRAIDRASEADAKWPDVALAFIVFYAKTHSQFISEECTAAAGERGIRSPTDPRAWGQPYRAAIRAGIIKRIGFGTSLRRHMAATPLYQSLVR